ncbi:MAG: GNAT family N-acetyltransferase [Oscillospiraceae bacterium]|nr:GNAT family N-acetyltransferase [Oscillospiraceae bacterium]
MELIQAQQSDFPRLAAFYRHVIDRSETMAEYCRWVYGLHPSDEKLQTHIRNGCMYFAEEDGAILAAAAVTPFQEEDFHGFPWGVEAADDQVAVVHLLCTDPLRPKTGLAQALLRQILAMARLQQKLAVRLDALVSNTPAHRLYEKLGFLRRGEASWYTSNAGQTDFYLYEYIL